MMLYNKLLQPLLQPSNVNYASDHIWPWDHNLTPISSMLSSVKWNYQPFLPLVDGIAWNNCNLEWFKSNQVIGFITGDVLLKYRISGM